MGFREVSAHPCSTMNWRITQDRSPAFSPTSLTGGTFHGRAPLGDPSTVSQLASMSQCRLPQARGKSTVGKVATEGFLPVDGLRALLAGRAGDRSAR